MQVRDRLSVSLYLLAYLLACPHCLHGGDLFACSDVKFHFAVFALRHSSVEPSRVFRKIEFARRTQLLLAVAPL